MSDLFCRICGQVLPDRADVINGPYCTCPVPQNMTTNTTETLANQLKTSTACSAWAFPQRQHLIALVGFIESAEYLLASDQVKAHELMAKIKADIDAANNL